MADNEETEIAVEAENGLVALTFADEDSFVIWLQPEDAEAFARALDKAAAEARGGNQ